MARFIVRRTLIAAVLVVATSFVVFAIFEIIPSYDPAAAIAGRTATAVDIQAVRHEFGLDKPFYVQYVKTMEQVFTNKVISYQTRLSVDDQFRQRFPATLSLVLPAAIIWMVLGVIFGTISAVRAGRLADRALTVLALVGVSIPVFLLAGVFLYFFAFKIHIFPNTGYTAITSNPLQWAKHLILPWFTLAILYVGFYSRVLRNNLLDTMNEDFVRTARAKGLTRRRVLLGHVLRNSVMPIITLFGLDFAAALGGATLVTETVFNIPGIGQYEANAIGRLDIPPILVGTIFTAFFVVLFSALVDIVHAYLDPRIRL
jgi:peptide/nickel transport system permease protein